MLGRLSFLIVILCVAHARVINDEESSSDIVPLTEGSGGEGVPSLRFGATHYNWAPRARKLVDYIIGRWYTRLNTYYDHPTGWGLDHVSIDCWDMKGRGYALAKSIGDPIANYLVNNANTWGVRWVIWYGRIWTPANGWQKYTDPSDMHYDHVHVTIW